MELLTALNLDSIFQLTFVGLITISGPMVIRLLTFCGGGF
ncbi:MAG: photosystem II reaction center protein Ycf12/Psb30 [cyanobacterium endosymbiont of Rhopalodia musculus]|nr:photosystem II reaction center protein Ycf12 [cyanobacterium endosymbiont of Epithemia clementina EcSB]WGT67564.1 photosystem II reaction center protein Ycf12 [cyanobacterium endosymbiont of Epithemia clementina EcSB]